MTTIVIKYGGHAMDDEALRLPFAKSVASLVKQGMRIVIVHGGGPHVNKMLQTLNIKSDFVDGLRVTTKETMEVVEMVLLGQVNKAVVSLLQEVGGKAVGISGLDGELFMGHVLNPELGLVGQVDVVNPKVVNTLLDADFIPVIAPAARDKDVVGQNLNVNADTAAGALAGALQADYFVLVSDVPGVLDAEQKLLPELDAEDIAKLKSHGTIYGGMIPKVNSCLYALNAGCKRSLILDGRVNASLERYLLAGEALGTIIK